MKSLIQKTKIWGNNAVSRRFGKYSFTKETSTAIFRQIFVAFLENLNCKPNQDKTRQNLYKLNVPLPISHTYTKKQVECRVENTTIDSILYEGFERPWDRARFDD